MNDLPRRGDIWWCEFPEIGRRPVVKDRHPAAGKQHQRLGMIGAATEGKLEDGLRAVEPDGAGTSPRTRQRGRGLG